MVLFTEGDRPAALRSAAKLFASVTGPWFQLSSARADRVVPVLALASSPATSAWRVSKFREVSTADSACVKKSACQCIHLRSMFREVNRGQCTYDEKDRLVTSGCVKVP